jgi:hypothetical protein
MAKRLVASEGQEKLTTKATTCCLLLNSDRGAGGAVVSKAEVAAGRKVAQTKEVSSSELIVD